MKNSVLLWFRIDLRLSDNPALQNATNLNRPIIPIYIHDDEDALQRKLGSASKWWLYHSLKTLSFELKGFGSRLLYFNGKAEKIIQQIIKETKSDTVIWNRRYEPWAIKRDTLIKNQLNNQGIKVASFNSNLLFEPWEIKSKTGNPLKVFTPYKNALLLKDRNSRIIDKPKKILSPKLWPASQNLNDLKLLDNRNWSTKFEKIWKPGNKEAKLKLDFFIKNRISNYDTDRNIPGLEGTSKLSPHLRFGEISPKEIINIINFNESKHHLKSLETFKSEIIWREFSHNLLWYFPEIHKKSIKRKFENFKWNFNNKNFDLWTKGLTGYPIVDAGMRELWSTGWMHNRVRMITASFLTKHLLLPWQLGESWFWNTLIDADPASNPSGWQWVSGCGADAAPYFRIFNPILQGQKFDPKGVYIKKFLPELKMLSPKFIHEPWKADSAILKNSDINLGETYPLPIVDHQFARKRALKKYAEIK